MKQDKPKKKKIKKAPSKMGRPKVTIDWKKVTALCQILCTKEEIASILEIDADTLNAHCKSEYNQTFSAYYKQKCVGGKMSIRRRQFEVAMAGNVAMLIWWGKNNLGQSDKTELSGTDVKPLVLKYSIK